MQILYQHGFTMLEYSHKVQKQIVHVHNSSMSNLGYLQTSLKDPLLSVSLF